MVAPTWCHGPTGGNPRWENVDRPDLRIYIFIILVIRLSKVQQMAISFRFTRRSPWRLTTARRSWDSPFSSEMHSLKAATTTSFSNFARETDHGHTYMTMKATGMSSYLQVFFLGF